MNKEYLNIIMVIIFVCIIIVPLAIANKNNLLPNSVTLVCLVIVLFLASAYILYKVVDIYMRDNIDFDKLRVPYDRNAAQLEKEGKLIRKKNPLTSLTLTCVGQDCCDGSMVYDYAKNKCLMTENFNNFFDGTNVERYRNHNHLVEPFGVDCAKDKLLQNSFSFSNGFFFHIPSHNF